MIGVARWLPLLAMLIAAAAVRAAPPADTAEVFSDWQDRVLQVQVIDLQADTKAGIGSGFVAGREDWVVTNYHVIADLVNRPGKYIARYLADDGSEGILTLLNVDPVHDLAVLRLDGLRREPLQLAPVRPPQGTRLYALGYPFDIGLTIVEGTYNGTLQKSLYEKLHFTGSINPGMSGGPTIADDGGVVGVNVSTAGNQVSFLVPVRHVSDLLADTDGDAPDVATLNARVAERLLANQGRIADALLAAETPRTRLDGYRVPVGMADWINCWGNSEDDVEENLSLVFQRCQTNDDIYLSGSLNTGIIRFQHDLVSTDSLGAWRFWRQMEDRSHFPRLRLDGDQQSVSNYHCQSDFVRRPALPLKATLCVRRYRNLAGLYDGFLTVTSLRSGQEALQSTLVLAGFSWDNLERLGTWFVDALAWGDDDGAVAP